MNIVRDRETYHEFARGEVVQAAQAVLLAVYTLGTAQAEHVDGVCLMLDYLVDEFRRLLYNQKLRAHAGPFDAGNDEAVATAKLVVFAALGFVPEV